MKGTELYNLEEEYYAFAADYYLFSNNCPGSSHFDARRPW
jgi:hypothetical protein